MDVFWGYVSALVRNAAEPIVLAARPTVAPYHASIGTVAEAGFAVIAARLRNINPKLISSHFHQRSPEARWNVARYCGGRLSVERYAK
jgi:hypothetical protein